MNIFKNKAAQQKMFVSECELSKKQAKRLKKNPNKFIDEEICNKDYEMSGEYRALLNGDADKAFWWALGFVLILMLSMFLCIGLLTISL